MPQMRDLRVVLLMLIALLPLKKWPLYADELSETPYQPLGGTYQFNPTATSKFLSVGCLDHRTLMFIVHEVEGQDPQTPRMLAERDCRPLLQNTDYIRCGPGGYAHPAKGEPLIYSAYCRKGIKDLQLYVLDLQMKSVK